MQWRLCFFEQIGFFDRAAWPALAVAADMNDPTIDRAIDTAHKLALRAKIDGTPTFLMNGHLHPGVVSASELADMMKAKPI